MLRRTSVPSQIEKAHSLMPRIPQGSEARFRIPHKVTAPWLVLGGLRIEFAQKKVDQRGSMIKTVDKPKPHKACWCHQGLIRRTILIRCTDHLE